MDFKDLKGLSCGRFRVAGRAAACLVAMAACSACSDDVSAPARQEEVRYKVAVVVPMSGGAGWKETAGWALSNYREAQAGTAEMISIDIEWHDEEAGDLDEYCRKVSRDGSYAAMIGPIGSGAARTAASYMSETGKTIILPAATSAEFQRLYADKGNVWNLAQSDIAQCELMLMQAGLYGVGEVSLLASDSDYGRSFSDWFAYQAVELGLNVGSVTVYGDTSELRAGMEELSQRKAPEASVVLFVPGSEDEAIAFDEEYGRLRRETEGFRFPSVFCSDVVNSPRLAASLKNAAYEGLSLSADPSSGFITAYRSKFGTDPANGEAHLYDAFLMLGYALKAQGEGEDLDDTLLRILDSGDRSYCSWFPADMRHTLEALRAGGTPNLEGVTGDWTFDGRHHASVLNTVYAHWVLSDGAYHILEYLSSDGTRCTTSDRQLWEEESVRFQEFNRDQEEREYGELHDRWAVVVSASDTWINYRHQADALAMYQLLRRHGYDDDHIILVCENNLADDPRNLYPGTVRVRPGGENVCAGVKADYALSEIGVDDLGDILTGRASERLPEVLSSGSGDNVIFFWCGHGNRNRLAWGSDAVVPGEAIRDIIVRMRAEGRFRKMLFVMDACYSGTIGEALTGIPGVLAITASNASEPSKADMRDPEMGIWLSNGFTRVFQETIDSDPSISISDLYYTLARHTTGSHATVYNVGSYGNVYTSRLDEYLSLR